MGTYLTNNLYTHVYSQQALYGQERLRDRWFTNKMTMSPDVHFALKQAHVKARSDGTGVVQFSFTLSSTVLVPADGSTHGDGSTIEPCADVKLPAGYAGSVTPVHMSLDGAVTMHLDANNRIYFTCFDCV
ncbi:hypothetical protein EON65_56100 [archaeon]|nr:MAG: hypothetical protein EON65_56100 [archaeon]